MYAYGDNFGKIHVVQAPNIRQARKCAVDFIWEREATRTDRREEFVRYVYKNIQDLGNGGYLVP